MVLFYNASKSTVVIKKSFDSPQHKGQ